MDEKWWWENAANIREDKVVVKLRNPDDSFKKSVILPTVTYPLTGAPEVFTYHNTQPVTNQRVLDIFDGIRYDHGACYGNTERLVQALRHEGFNTKSYVGWLFTSISEYPVHHCWAVLDNSVLDLADDFTAMLSGQNGKLFHQAENRPEEVQELIVSFAQAASKVKNSVRCQTVGVPTPFLFYVGSPCEPDQGRVIYNDLIRRYPSHECQRNVDSDGFNKTQRAMHQAGLMQWTNRK